MSLLRFLKKFRQPRSFPDSSTAVLLPDTPSGSQSESCDKRSSEKKKRSIAFIMGKRVNTKSLVPPVPKLIQDSQSISSSQYLKKNAVLPVSLIKQRPGRSSSTFGWNRKSTRQNPLTRRFNAFRMRNTSANRTFATNKINKEADLSLLPSVLHDSSSPSPSILTLHGRITDKVLKSLHTGVRSLKKIVFDEANIAASPSQFRYMIRYLRVESISFFGCIFEDAQIISDEFFYMNKQITDVTVGSRDGMWQSFPLLTDRTLDKWSASGIQPPFIHFNNVDTSFTIQGVQRLVKSFLSIAFPYDHFCMKFGRIDSSMRTVMNCLSLIKELKVHQVHTSFVYALSHNPRIEMNFQTRSIDYESVNDFTVPQKLNGLWVLSASISNGILHNSEEVEEEVNSKPLSVMITKPGILSKSKRVYLKKCKRQSKRFVRNVQLQTLKSNPSFDIL